MCSSTPLLCKLLSVKKDNYNYNYYRLNDTILCNEISHEIKQVTKTDILQLHQFKKSYKYNCGVVVGQ